MSSAAPGEPGARRAPREVRVPAHTARCARQEKIGGHSRTQSGARHPLRQGGPGATREPEDRTWSAAAARSARPSFDWRSGTPPFHAGGQSTHLVPGLIHGDLLAQALNHAELWLPRFCAVSIDSGTNLDLATVTICVRPISRNAAGTMPAMGWTRSSRSTADRLSDLHQPASPQRFREQGDQAPRLAAHLLRSAVARRSARRQAP